MPTENLRELIVDWRALLDRLRIDWFDRGKNVSRGNINIACPWCGLNDPSYHLSISEEIEAYVCMRDRRHRGRNFAYLLEALGCSRVDAIQFLETYRTDAAPVSSAPRDDARIVRQWGRFENASTSTRMLDYLADERGFDDPSRLCKRYDLRFAATGKWAQRLLLPILVDGEVYSWTGRAVKTGLVPKYRMPPTEESGLLYIPRPPESIAVIVEGPIDALKIADAMEGTAIGAIALVTNSITPEKIVRMREHIARCSKAFVVLDEGTSSSASYAIIHELDQLAMRARNRYIKRLRLPLGYHDPGEMPRTEIKQWLKGVE